MREAVIADLNLPRFLAPGDRPFATLELHNVEGVPVRIYNPAKTVADCFKYRNKIGMEVVLDALRRYRARHGLRGDALMRCARVCRVHNVMRPYLEATL